jgi:hypothetical protein
MYVVTLPNLSRDIADVRMQETVSSRAKTLIGRDSALLDIGRGQPADLVLFDSFDSGWRCRKSIVEVVYDAGFSRKTVFRGRLIVPRN